MKIKIKNNQAQLLLVTGVLLATTILIIGEVATHTITLGVESSLERSHSLAWEYVVVKEKFLLAFKENVKSIDKYYKNSSIAINKAFEKTEKEFEKIEAYYGIIFIAVINNVTALGNRNFEVNFTLKMKDSNTNIEEDIVVVVELFATDEWWENSEKWNYRIPIIVNTNIVDALIQKNINFTEELENFKNSVFDENSTRVIEYNDNGKILWEVPSQFNKEIVYNSETNAVGNILWFANGTNNKTRYYYIYFDNIEKGVKQKTNYETLLSNPIIGTKNILEDNVSIYNFTPYFPIISSNRISGNNSFNSDGNCYFENVSLDTINNDIKHISFWLYFNNSHADILFGVQVNDTWASWGFDADKIYNGSDLNESIKGNTTNVSCGIWLYFKVNLIEDLKISPGSNFIGIAFFSDNVFYDHVVFDDIIAENVEQLVTSSYS